jgi:polyribonucleotide nucleotidyltransferase
MHITEYFVILYSELQEIINKFKVAYLHHQSMLNLEDNTVKQAAIEAGKEAGIEAVKQAAIEAGKEAGIEADIEAGIEADIEAVIEAGKEAAIEAGKEAAIEAAIEAGNEASKEASKEAEEEINLKEIYRKLLFIFHPDKSISPNEQIFGEIKKAWDDKYEPTIVFYFIKNSNHPMLKIIHDKLYNTKVFLKTLKNLCNIITKEINDIRRTPIWKKYYSYKF